MRKLLSAVAMAAALLFGLPAARGAALWLTNARVSELPASGDAWDHLTDEADNCDTTVHLETQGDDGHLCIFANALVCKKLTVSQGADYCTAAEDGLADVVTDNPIDAQGTNCGSGEWDQLQTMRALGTLATSAYLIDSDDEDFETWITDARDAPTQCNDHPDCTGGCNDNVVDTQEDRPNNYGLHAGFSRMAIDGFIGDGDDLQAAMNVFIGWTGDTGTYNGFTFGDTAWQATPSAPVGVNAQGATISGHDVDGVLPEEMRRCWPANTFSWPPDSRKPSASDPNDPDGTTAYTCTYPWEGMQGAVETAELMAVYGYPAFALGDYAVCRSAHWLYNTDFDPDEAPWPAMGDDEWIPYILNMRCPEWYTSGLSTEDDPQSGKAVGFTDWTHQFVGGGGDPPEPDPNDPIMCYYPYFPYVYPTYCQEE